MLVDCVLQFETHWGLFSPNSTDSLCLLVAQVPRPPDMAIFLLNDNNDNNNDDTTDYFTPIAHARGVIIIII